MNSETPDHIKKWEATREKGKARYILVNGVVAWGLPMFAVMTFILNRDRPKTDSFSMVLLSAVIWTIGGACFGLAMWIISERKYQKYLAGKLEGKVNE